MVFNQKIELIISLRNTSLTIWGFLLTVAIGILAFIATFGKKELELSIGLSIIALYTLFAVSNINALRTNFLSRCELLLLAKKHDEYDAFKKLLALNVPSTIAIRANMLFHVLIDALVITMIILSIKWPKA